MTLVSLVCFLFVWCSVCFWLCLFCGLGFVCLGRCGFGLVFFGYMLTLGLGTTFYRGSDGAIFVYDVSRKETFEELAQWKRSFLIQIGEEGNNDYPMLVIANKIDRADRVVTTEMGRNFCAENNVEYLECSAKEDTNVDVAFEKIAQKVLENTDPADLQYDDPEDAFPDEEKKEGCCD